MQAAELYSPIQRFFHFKNKKKEADSVTVGTLKEGGAMCSDPPDQTASCDYFRVSWALCNKIFELFWPADRFYVKRGPATEAQLKL